MTTATLSGLTPGTWNIDPVHSEVGFSVRHLMVSKVKGSFKTFSGTITVPEDPTQARVEVDVDITSVDTGEPNRDNHLRSDDFFSAEQHPKMTFVSTKLDTTEERFELTGDLTIKGVSKPVVLTGEFNGVGPDPWGGTRAGFSAETEISRKEFGIDFEMPLEGGGVVVGDRIRVILEIEAALAQS